MTARKMPTFKDWKEKQMKDPEFVKAYIEELEEVNIKQMKRIAALEATDWKMPEEWEEICRAVGYAPDVIEANKNTGPASQETTALLHFIERAIACNLLLTPTERDERKEHHGR